MVATVSMMTPTDSMCRMLDSMLNLRHSSLRASAAYIFCSRSWCVARAR